MDTEVIESVEKQTALPTTKIDGTWITTYKDGLKWPVVICDDSLAPEPFIATRHGDDEIAAILLGKRKFIWVFDDTLEEYDMTADYIEFQEYECADVQGDDDEATKNQKNRQKAFGSDAVQFAPAKFWANLISNSYLVRKAEKDRQNARRKVNSSSSKRRASEYDPSGHTHATKRQVMESVSSSPVSSQSQNHEVVEKQDQRLTTKKRPGEKTLVHRTKTAAPMESSESCEDDVDSPNLTVDESVRLQEAFNAKRNDSSCTIIVGEKQVPMVVNRRMVHQCEHLGSLEAHNAKGHYVIDISSTHKIAPKQFMPIFDFFRTETIGPTLSDSPPHLCAADLRRKDYWAQYLSSAFVTAHKIQHTALQRIIYDKIIPLYPLDPGTLLYVALTFCLISTGDGEQNEVEKEMHLWITEHVTKFYWLLARDSSDAGILRGLLARDPELRQGVYQTLAREPQAGREGLDDELHALGGG